MMVTRNMEDFITWVDGSSRKRTIMKYNDEVSRRHPVSLRLSTSRLLMQKSAFSPMFFSWTTLTFYKPGA